MILETERLILRPWQESDAEACFECARDPAVGPIAGWPPHRTIEDSLYVIRHVLNAPQCYAICLRDSLRAIGAIELKLNGHTDMTDRDDECELGYWIGVPYWGKGYMQEAARELLRHAFEDLNMTAVWCGYYEGNARSAHTQERLGFVYQHKTEGLELSLLGEIRTGHVSLLTREKWQRDLALRLTKEHLKEITGILTPEGRLTQLPSKRKKKLIALSYLANRIPAGISYTERDFNRLLLEMHTFSDPATLRRELFDHFLINRTPDGREYTLNQERPTIDELIIKYC